MSTISDSVRGPWSPDSFRERPAAQHVHYEDPAAVEAAVHKLRSLPPLVNSWEVERLKHLLSEAQEGKRFLLQGGDCAETLDDCRASIITSKIKILLQMSLVLVHGSKRPIIRVGRFAGQYGKPRSSPTERRMVPADGPEANPQELPSYFGDLYNRPEFTAAARRPDPDLMVTGYQHAALTLNFIRSLAAGGFADLHHPEYWDLGFFDRAELPADLREEYQRTTREMGEALRFMEALGESKVETLTRVEFFTSHEGLNLFYESAQTRVVPQWPGHYDLTTHLPWIGERTRALSGAHVEFFRGVKNPIGIKLGPSAQPDEVAQLCEVLNPADEAGKILLIARVGAARAEEVLPKLVEGVKREGRRVLWVCDPMHGNTQSLSSGLKTRSFDNILREVEISFDVHQALGSVLGGVHFELTGEDVTECIGGGLSEKDLDKNYASRCDPRLNYRQALEMAYRLARRMSRI